MNEHDLGWEVVSTSAYNTPTIAEVKRDKFVTYELGNYAEGEHKNS